MIIMIVEDDEHKRAQIEAVVTSTYPDAGIVTATSVNAAVKRLASGDVNLLLLDMSLPVYEVSVAEDGLSHLSYGGKEVLEYLERRHHCVPVIVVTAFDTFGTGQSATSLEELDRALRTEYPTLYVGHVWYSASVRGWEEQLRDHIHSITAGPDGHG